MTASYIYAASQPHTCATHKPHHLHLVHQASIIYASIIMMVHSLTTSMMMGDPPAGAPDEGEEFIISRTGLIPMVKTNNYTLSTSLLLLHIMLLVGHSSPLTSRVMNLNRLPILLQWISHRNAPEVKGYIGRTYETAGTYQVGHLRSIPPPAEVPEVGDVELLKVPPWIIGEVFCEPNDFLIRWTTMASTVVKCVLHYVAMYVLLPHLILRPLVTHMDVSKVNWQEGRTSILPGVYQDNCNYIFKPSAAVTKGDTIDTIMSILRPCRTQHWNKSDLINYPRTFYIYVYKCNLPSQGRIVNNEL